MATKTTKNTKVAEPDRQAIMSQMGINESQIANDPNIKSQFYDQYNNALKANSMANEITSGRMPVQSVSNDSPVMQNPYSANIVNNAIQKVTKPANTGTSGVGATAGTTAGATTGTTPANNNATEPTAPTPQSSADAIKELLEQYKQEFTYTPFDYEGAFKGYDALAQNSRDQSINAANETLQRLTENARQNYGNSMEDINRQAEDALRQAYISNMLGQKNLSDQLARNGISGGATESIIANLISNYQNNRNDVYTKQSDNIRDLNIAQNNALNQLMEDYFNSVNGANSDYFNKLLGYRQDINSQMANSSENDKQAANAYLNNMLSQISGAIQNDTDAANKFALQQYINSFTANENQKDRDQQTALNNTDWANKFEFQANDQNWQSNENAQDWLNKLLYQKNDQNWQSAENDKQYAWKSDESEKDRQFTASQNALDWANKFLFQGNEQNFTANQNALDWANKFKYLGEEQNFTANQNELNRNLEITLKQMGIDADTAKALARYASQGSGSGNGNGDGSGDGSGIVQNEVTPVSPYIPNTPSNTLGNAVTEANGIYKNSNGNMDAVSNNVLTKVANNNLTADEALDVLGSVSSTEKNNIDNAKYIADAIYKNSGGNVTAVGNTIAGMAQNNTLSKGAATLIVSSYYDK